MKTESRQKDVPDAGAVQLKSGSLRDDDQTVVGRTRSILISAALDQAWERVVEWATDLATTLRPGEYPEAAVDGKWRLTHGKGWTEGFWPGILWLLYGETGDGRWRDAALRWTTPLTSRASVPDTHDLGFLLYPTFVRGSRLDGDASLAGVAVQGARSLAKRFNPRGDYLQAWGPPSYPFLGGRAIVDTMMNLPLMWWAAQSSGQEELARIATAVARTVQRDHVRSDGTTVHVCDYDQRTGKLIQRTTRQGFSAESCWSRGQAWAIAGFALAHRFSGEPEFLGTSTDLADWWLRNVPRDLVPPWDFRAPSEPGALKDSSAGAIAAYGFLELARAHSGNPERRRRYRQAALQTVTSLARDCLADAQPTLVLHGTQDLPGNRGMDCGLIFGDHYFVKALAGIRTLSRSSGGAVGT